ncbi:hypothetical protein [Swingsia samuiensis]|uniref:Uncharacterized protein n=1 Tax=Swingsia samuiensis TaxID=1293412 RepID=A0A4Y6UII8_9PROT|nr:hypothetical protein [Swingsia samuiensis]QDH17439.1 hypothetical protein E3D00_07580 [Swingsia samuiensis]
MSDDKVRIGGPVYERNAYKKIEIFNKWMEIKGIKNECPECRGKQFSLMGKDDASTVLTVDNKVEFYATYSLACANCGYIKSFVASMIEEGIKQEESGEHE